MEKVILLPEVIYQLNQLVKSLYEKEYFGFIDSALDYTDMIYDFIFSIPHNPYKGGFK